ANIRKASAGAGGVVGVGPATGPARRIGRRYIAAGLTAGVDHRAWLVRGRVAKTQDLLAWDLLDDLAGPDIHRLVDVGAGRLVFLDDQSQIGRERGGCWTRRMAVCI